MKELGLADGDDVQLRVQAPRELLLSKKPGKAQVLEALREFRGRLPADFSFDRDAANER